MSGDPAWRSESLPLSLEKRVDEACDRFEAAWRAHQQPRIEGYLTDASELEKAELFRQLLALEIELRSADGNSATTSEYQQRFREYSDLIRVAFEKALAISPTDESPSELEFPSSRYQLLEEIGRGAMGAVYRARHRKLGKQVAIKVLLPGQSTERFLREAKLLAALSSPFILAVHDFDALPDGSPILCMDWVEGLNLLQKIQLLGGRAPEDVAIPWMRQVCEGMRAAADQGVIHRDLKPSNILIDTTGRVRVADFGLARGPEALGDLSRSGNIMGTPYYMAPEQAE